MSTQLARPVRRAVGLVLLGGILVAAVVLWSRTDAEARTAPYEDPQAAGGITLCSGDGEPVTEGSVDDTPFAAVALGSTGVPSDLDDTGAVGTLYAYQPREGVSPSEFSGTAITAAGVLADPDRPAVAVTEDSWSVGDFVTAYPADFDGYVQLRLYLGTPAAGTLSDRPYDTADLRVDGDRWELVAGGSAACTATQTSEEN